MSKTKKNEEKKPTLAFLKADPKTGKPSKEDVTAFMKELFGPDYGETKDDVASSS
jgi:hypothetical protein